MGMCAQYEGCALPALVGSTLVGSWLPDAKHWADFIQVSSPMTAIRGSRTGLMVPSIAHAIISLCSVAD
jgi:hypothetical protein